MLEVGGALRLRFLALFELLRLLEFIGFIGFAEFVGFVELFGLIELARLIESIGFNGLIRRFTLGEFDYLPPLRLEQRMATFRFYPQT